MSVQGRAGNSSQRNITPTPSWEAGEGHSSGRSGHRCSSSSALSERDISCKHSVRSLLLALEGAVSQIKVLLLCSEGKEQLQELLPVSQCNSIVDSHGVIRQLIKMTFCIVCWQSSVPGAVGLNGNKCVRVRSVLQTFANLGGLLGSLIPARLFWQRYINPGG